MKPAAKRYRKGRAGTGRIPGYRVVDLEPFRLERRVNGVHVEGTPWLNQRPTWEPVRLLGDLALDRALLQFLARWLLMHGGTLTVQGATLRYQAKPLIVTKR